RRGALLDDGLLATGRRRAVHLAGLQLVPARRCAARRVGAQTERGGARVSRGLLGSAGLEGSIRDSGGRRATTWLRAAALEIRPLHAAGGRQRRYESRRVESRGAVPGDRRGSRRA